MPIPLGTLVGDWKKLLTDWGESGALTRAAREALMLEGEPEPLLRLVNQWRDGDFSGLPPIVLLPASSMPGAIGAYAISTGTIYLNQDWMAGASAAQVIAVLTEELGHHLDGILNAVDTPGDEGEFFARMLTGEKLTAQQQSAIHNQSDQGQVVVNADKITVEQASTGLLWSTPIATAANDSAGRLSISGEQIVVGESISATDGVWGSAQVEAFDRSTGISQWQVNFGSDDKTYIAAVAHAPDGSIFVTGGTREVLNGQTYGGAADGWISKLSRTGQVLWTKNFSNQLEDDLSNLVVDSYGNAYMAGGVSRYGYRSGSGHFMSDYNYLGGDQSYGGSNFTGNWMSAIRKVDADGNAVWTRVDGSFNSGGGGLTIDPGLRVIKSSYTFASVNGQSAIAGRDNGNGSNVCDYLISYKLDGTVEWTKMKAQVTALAADQSTHYIYIGNQNFLEKLDQAGNVAWSKSLGSFALDIAIDSAGYIYVITQNGTNGLRETIWTPEGITTGSSYYLASGALSASDIQISAEGTRYLAGTITTGVLLGSDDIAQGARDGVIWAIDTNTVSHIVRGNRIYTLVDGPSWLASEANSIQIGGHLVAISSQNENSFIKTRFSDALVTPPNALPNAPPTENLWIGLSDHEQEGDFRWSNGEALVYQNWNAPEPNNLNNQDYVQMYGSGEWDDYDLRVNGYYEVGKGVAEIPFIRRGDSAYVIVQGPRWEEAEANAVKLNGHLVTINDAEENSWLVDTYSNKSGEYQGLWIGLNDVAIEGDQKWSSGETATFRNFGAGEPNGGSGENYFHMWSSNPWGYGVGKWNDIDNYPDQGFADPSGMPKSFLGIAEIKLAPNNKPTGNPTLLGAFKVGETISIDKTGIQDADGFYSDFSYAWEASADNGTTWNRITSTDGTDNNSAYILTSAEVGKKVRGVVSYLDGYGSDETVVSDSSGLIGNATPIINAESLSLSYLDPGFSSSVPAALDGQLTAVVLDGSTITYGPPSSTGTYGTLTVSSSGATSFTGDTAAITSQSTSTLTDSFSVTASNGGQTATATYNVAIANPSAENTLLITATASGSIDGISFGSTASTGAYAGKLLNSIHLGSSADTASLTNAAGTTAALTLDGGNGFDRLNGNASANNLTLTGLDSGTLDQVSFSSIENIDLQGGNDTVTIEAGGGLTGILDGGAGYNTLIVDPSLRIDIADNGTINVGGGSRSFSGFQSIQGSGGTGSNSLTLNANSNFVAITGPNSGTADGTSFTNISEINLASGDDYAILASVGSLSGSLAGGDGTDDLTLNASANALTLDQTGAGTVTSAGNAVSTAFNGFEVIRLDAGSDVADLSFSATTALATKQQLRLEGGLDHDTVTLNLSDQELLNLQSTNQLASLEAYLAAPTGKTITVHFLQTSLTLSGFESGAFKCTVSLALSPSSVTEDGTTNLLYTFSRTGATAAALTVNYTVAGSATLGTDYTGIAATPATKTISFAAGASTAVVSVDPTADSSIEADETVALTLAPGTDYTVGTTTAVVGTITNDDLPRITLTISPASVQEDGVSNLIYTFSRTGDTAAPLTVNYTVAGTATLGTDYTGIAATPATKTIIFAAGASTAKLSVDPTADSTIEATETVSLTLATGTGYTVGTVNAVVGRITNDDFPVITLAVVPEAVAEDGSANLIYTFSRTGATTSALTVKYTVGGTATLSTDYTGIATTAVTKTISFAAGASTAIVTVNPTADGTVEANETVALTLASGTGYTIGTATPVVGTITNDDASTYMSMPISPASPGRTNGEWLNIGAFSALKADGSVISWGYGGTGGDNSAVASQLSSGVRQIFSAGTAFAALKSDGSVVSWGNGDGGGNSNAVASQLSSGVNQIFSSYGAFAAIKADGSVVSWGNNVGGGDSSAVASQLSSGVRQLFSTTNAFAALKTDGSVISWGSDVGTISSAVASQLSTGVRQIFSTTNAFAALKADGSVVTWGKAYGGGDSSAVASLLLSGVRQIFASANAFAALKGDGSVVTWGDGGSGGDSSTVANLLLSGVSQIFSTGTAFAALKTDGSVVTWGYWGYGGNSNAVASQLSSGVSQIFSTYDAFAALKSDGSVVTWGDGRWGGNSSAVAGQLGSGVSQIFSTGSAFAALKADGSVVTWGDGMYGGNSSAVASQLKSGVSQISSTNIAFAALKSDGSVVSWGDYAAFGGNSSPSSGVVGLATPYTRDVRVDVTPIITLAVSPAAATEDGSANLIYTFSRTDANTAALTVNYTVGGTADLGTDYTGIAATPATKTIRFAAGASTAILTVNPSADTSVEANETVAISLATGTGYTVGTTTPVVGTIQNDDVSSSTSKTLAAGQSSLNLTGTGRINGIGNTGDNSIIGNSSDNQIIGRGGKDTLTGSSNPLANDIDSFGYGSISDSLLAAYDVITDFRSVDKILAPTATIGETLYASLGTIDSLSATSLASLLTPTSFLANAARAFVVSGSTGTFLALNDATDGYQPNQDAIIHLQNYSVANTTPIQVI